MPTGGLGIYSAAAAFVPGDRPQGEGTGASGQVLPAANR